MEIVLPGFNIDSAIDTHWKSAQAKAENIQTDRATAEATAFNSLISQFKRELDTCLDAGFQASLNLKIVPPKEVSALAVGAVFSFMNTEVLLKRNADMWEIAFNAKVIPCFPDLLQKTILMELGKLKNAGSQ